MFARESDAARSPVNHQSSWKRFRFPKDDFATRRWQRAAKRQGSVPILLDGRPCRAISTGEFSSNSSGSPAFKLNRCRRAKGRVIRISHLPSAATPLSPSMRSKARDRDQPPTSGQPNGFRCILAQDTPADPRQGSCFHPPVVCLFHASLPLPVRTHLALAQHNAGRYHGQ